MNDNKNGFTITNRDRVLRAWQNSTQQVCDFQAYADETKDDKTLSSLFSKYAEDEALHASELRDILKNYRDIN